MSENLIIKTEAGNKRDDDIDQRIAWARLHGQPVSTQAVVRRALRQFRLLNAGDKEAAKRAAWLGGLLIYDHHTRQCHYLRDHKAHEAYKSTNFGTTESSAALLETAISWVVTVEDDVSDVILVKDDHIVIAPNAKEELDRIALEAADRAIAASDAAEVAETSDEEHNRQVEMHLLIDIMENAEQLANELSTKEK